eukprot:6181371-Pleurochrysis_carterae.AAC.6
MSSHSTIPGESGKIWSRACCISFETFARVGSIFWWICKLCAPQRGWLYHAGRRASQLQGRCHRHMFTYRSILRDALLISCCAYGIHVALCRIDHASDDGLIYQLGNLLRMASAGSYGLSPARILRHTLHGSRFQFNEAMTAALTWDVVIYFGRTHMQSAV